MSESGFDVLKGFQPEGGSITYEPYTPIVPQNTPIEYQQERAEKAVSYTHLTLPTIYSV